MQTLTGAAAILAACDNHPMARFALGNAADPTGYGDSSGVLFVGEVRDGRRHGYYVGRPGLFPDVLAEAARRGLTDGLGAFFLPDDCSVPDGMSVRDHWDLLWISERPDRQPHQDEVVALAASAPVEAEINALLDLAMPDSSVRPGHASGPRWYGIRVNGVLVACGADRSGRRPHPAPAGAIGGIAVHPDHRGRGYGAAISAGVTVALFETYDLVTLGVWSDDEPAQRVYRRLGYSAPYRIATLRRSS